ncbi:ribosome maturation factor RimP [Desulfobacterales bacterium HSG16]|nr:ribosome maturation factor RimP [Desulfobacterales bacterium HSG16]
MSIRKKKAGSARKKTGARNRKFRHSAIQVAADVKKLAMPVCEAMGIELVCVEFERMQADGIVAVYIDKPGGVMLEDCSYVSRQLGDLLDVHNIPGLETSDSYRLEVSSPGVERPIGKREDYQKFMGSMVKIEYEWPKKTGRSDMITQKRTSRGILQEITQDMVILAVDSEIIEIPCNKILKARLLTQNGEKR